VILALQSGTRRGAEDTETIIAKIAKERRSRSTPDRRAPVKMSRPGLAALSDLSFFANFALL
jgi:hypothetical protein